MKTLLELKREGRIGAVSFGIYPINLRQRIFANYDLDAGLASERLTGALLDRLTHRVHILEASGLSSRLQDAKRWLKRKQASGRESN